MARLKPLILQTYYMDNSDLFYRTWLHEYEIEFVRHCIFEEPYNSSTVHLIRHVDIFKLGLAPIANYKASREVHSSSSHGASNAPSLAAILNEFANGTLVSRRGYDMAVTTDPGEREAPPFDINLRVNVAFTKAGFCVDFFGKNWLGWAGAGGSLQIWHPAAQVVMVYVPTRLNPRQEHVNAIRLRKAIEMDLGILP